MTDNRTNEPTEAQVEAAMVGYNTFPNNYPMLSPLEQHRVRIRAALKAADAVCCAHPKCPGGSLCCCQSDAVVTERDAEVAAKAWAEGYKLTPMTDNVEIIEILNPYRRATNE